MSLIPRSSPSSRTPSAEFVKCACAKAPVFLEGSQESVVLTRRTSAVRLGSSHFRDVKGDESSDTKDSPSERTSWSYSMLEPSSEEPTQASEPVPFSSTPDLGSRNSSSSSNSAFKSVIVVTPPQDRFTRVLDQKLNALLQADKSSPYQHMEQDADDWSNNSSQSPDEYETTPSVSESGRAFMKRKRMQSKESQKENVIIPGSQSSKKRKQTSFSYAAVEKASIRQAHSLSACSSFVSNATTEPVTSSGVSTPGIPIIDLPPFDLIPKPYLSSDDAAESRLRVLIKKDAALRARDGFATGINPVFDQAISPEQMGEFLGLDESLRRTIVEWLLTIVPSRKTVGRELLNQLRTCPETRFHAVQLFTRYFLRVGNIMRLWRKETLLMKLSRERIIWSVAVSCLALAVKFNRDFLAPLEPVNVSDFLSLSKEPMGHDDFEVSQRDVLQVLNYEIRDTTPEPYMEEIWNCLPTLRKLISFTGGWEEVKVNAWQMLNAAATFTEMLQFPMYLLVAAAIVEGLLDTLTAAYEEEAPDAVTVENAAEDARIASSGVIKDIRDLMSINSADMKSCRKWLIKIADLP